MRPSLATPDDGPDYPALYDSADATAARQQTRHFRLVRAELLGLLLAAGAGAIPLAGFGDGDVARRVIAGIVVVFLILVLLFRLRRRIERYEERWFQSRALAESVKVESWRYMMKAEPYLDSGASTTFGKRIGLLLDSNLDVFGVLAETPAAGTLQITDAMKAVRSRPLATRSAYYLAHRAHDQRAWYVKRAKQHQDRGKRWGWVSFAAEAAAILFAVVALVFGLGLESIGILTTGSAAAVAWVQARDFRRLATTYNLVAHDLMRLEAEVGTPASQESLGSYVTEVERTLSREHTYWLSRQAGH